MKVYSINLILSCDDREFTLPYMVMAVSAKCAKLAAQECWERIKSTYAGLTLKRLEVDKIVVKS